jgi:hypothetical protein
MRQGGGGGPGGGLPVPEAFHGADAGIAGQAPPGRRSPARRGNDGSRGRVPFQGTPPRGALLVRGLPSAGGSSSQGSPVHRHPVHRHPGGPPHLPPDPFTSDTGPMTPPLRTLDHPELTPFLPLIYVAWADGILTPGELDHIAQRTEELCDLEEEARGPGQKLAGPAPPPHPGGTGPPAGKDPIGGRLGHRRRTALPGGPGRRPGPASARPRKRGTERPLTEAPGRAPPGGGRWTSEGGLRTLEAVEELLGVLGGEAAQALLAPEPAEAAPDEPTPPDPSFDVQRMRRYLDGPQGPLRREIMELLRDPRFQTPRGEGLSHDDYRERTLEGLRELARRGYGMRALPESVGGQGDIAGSIAVFETLAHGDMSLLVKFGVQFGLFGGSVAQLGTETHHQKWLADIGPGASGMLRHDRGLHGSNVRELETRARFLPERGRLRDPHAPSRGPEGLDRERRPPRTDGHGLRPVGVGDEEHGVHAFLVPIRDEAGEALPGVEIEDCGPKVGLNGVDNGRLAFHQVRIPRRTSWTASDGSPPRGVYESPINSPGALLHHAGHAGHRADLHRRRLPHRRPDGPGHRGPLLGAAPPVRASRGPEVPGPGLPHPAAPPPPPAGHHLRPPLRRPGARPGYVEASRRGGGGGPGGGAGGGAQGGTPPATPWRPSRPPGGVRGQGYLADEPARSSGPTPTSSPPSRAPTWSSSSWWPEGLLSATGRRWGN